MRNFCDISCIIFIRLLAFYVVAREYNYVKPNMVERQIIAVEQGRHPLQEFLTIFVPNDTYSGDGKSLVKILTGPNASGKSTYLKQIALIVFMAHIGCYVPAKSATIGTVTHILTQITSMDSIALNTSMFLQDMRQVKNIFQKILKIILKIFSKEQIVNCANFLYFYSMTSSFIDFFR